MIKVDSRESAHVKSRVQDLSVVPNLVSFTGLFAAITPIAKAEKNSDGLFEPVLIRDVESLIANFGDPRIDPEKYIDLYSIMQVVGNGTSCYVAKVNSGTQGVYHFNFIPSKINADSLIPDASTNTAYIITDTPVYPTSLAVTGFEVDSEGGVFGFDLTDPATATAHLSTEGDDQVLILELADLEKVEVAPDTEEGKFRTTITFSEAHPVTEDVTIKINSFQSTPSLIGYSSMTEKLDFACKLVQAKPLSLKVFYLTVDVLNESNDILCSAKVKLESTTTNQSIVNNLNSSLGTYVRFELGEDGLDYANAAEVNDMRDFSIANVLLDIYAPHTGTVNNTAEPDRTSPRKNLELSNNVYEVALPRNNAEDGDQKDVDPDFKVMLQDYIDALNQYRDKRYTGCLMADFTAPVSHYLKDGGGDTRVDGATDDAPITVMPLDPEERRALHYNLKQIACERKDTTVILSTPYTKGYGTAALNFFTMDDICDWVASQGSFTDLWEYGSANTTDYSIQSFYLEIYYSWLNLKCTKLVNGLAKSVTLPTAPANIVVNNILTSWRERGVQYPVAGDQYGVLTDQCSVLQNPKTKLERDQLVQYRINPIWDTGTRGVQIYGNETLNAGYTDLNAAHIARALVYIRSHIDEYTERLKFSINSIVLWDTWKNHVTQFLESMKTSNCLSEYRVLMGTETTSAAEIANRKVNGLIQLIFYQSAEIFDLTYTIYSSSTTIDEATANQ